MCGKTQRCRSSMSVPFNDGITYEIVYESVILPLVYILLMLTYVSVLAVFQWDVFSLDV